VLQNCLDAGIDTRLQALVLGSKVDEVHDP
jgi:hypothetical protein